MQKKNIAGSKEKSLGRGYPQTFLVKKKKEKNFCPANVLLLSLNSSFPFFLPSPSTYHTLSSPFRVSMGQQHRHWNTDTVKRSMSSSRHQGYMVGRVGRVVGLRGASDAAPVGCFKPVCRFQGSSEGMGGYRDRGYRGNGWRSM